MTLQEYLAEFKKIADEWFSKTTFLKKNYDFFQEFFKRENLEKAEWEDFQAIGEHIHSFNSMAIAKGNALGKPNHPIEHYRKSFLYLIFGSENVEDRITNFCYNDKFKIKYFGKSVISELLGYLFAEKFVLYNERDRFALKLLNIDPGFSRGDKFTQKYLKFNKAIQPVKEAYEQIVGQKTTVPINLEVDQFFSFLYEKYKSEYHLDKKEKTAQQFLRFFIPIIEVLKELGGSATSAEVTDLAIGMLNISEKERTETLKSGSSRVKNQIAWARAYLVKTGFIDSSQRGIWKLTAKGLNASLTEKDVLRYCKEVQDPFKKDSIVPDDVQLIDEEENRNYWWLNANPKMWNLNELPVGSKDFYTTHNKKGNKRRIYKYFEEVKPNDIVLGYITAPQKEIVAICKITKGLNLDQENEAIEFEKIEQLKNPIRLDELHRIPELKNCEPIINNQGSLFKIRPVEYEIIRNLIDETNPPVDTSQIPPYLMEAALSDLFLNETGFDEIINLLKYKKNIILQGPPGVGKSYIAKRIAYTLIGFKDIDKVEMVQFHQSYAYEDFIQGFRPNEDGNFYLQNGVFYDFCRKAQRDSENNYVFIIDEINRGNLSKIFGELMLLIESDKRRIEFAIPLTYSQNREEKFYIPPNLYLIGMMNTADRSLAMVDYALRRRFTFIDLEPEFNSRKFTAYLITQGVDENLVQKIIGQMNHLNEKISEDKNLGAGYRIGHSFFCADKNHEKLDESWYNQIINYEIKPLIREYWFDDRDKAESYINSLFNE